MTLEGVKFRTEDMNVIFILIKGYNNYRELM